MSLEAFFKGMAITQRELEKRGSGRHRDLPVQRLLPGAVRSGCASSPTRCCASSRRSRRESARPNSLPTRIVEIPVLYNDPWTSETLMRFRERHQDPNSTDIEYAARINGYRRVDDFIAAHSGAPWFVSMVGFVAGLPFLYQMVEREKQIEVPKYLRPRTDTPKLTVGHGGCFGASIRCAAPAAIRCSASRRRRSTTRQQKLPLPQGLHGVFRPGDIVKLKPIDREEYDRDVKKRSRPARFEPDGSRR